MKKLSYYLLLAPLMILSCTNGPKSKSNNKAMIDTSETYRHDRDFLQKHIKIVELSNDESKVLIAPKYQARVMTSSCQGDSGFSFGWINHALIDSGKYMQHINAFGGEERFWIGPEGGQFSLFFKKGDPFDLDHWQTPAIIDTVGFDLVKKQADIASFTKTFSIQNYSGTQFHVKVDREIKLLDNQTAEKELGVQLSDVKGIGYQTTNSIQNIGDADWNYHTGVLSIWLLSMMKSSELNTVIIPYQKGGMDQINDSYFGKVPAERLIKRDSVLFFKADAKFRSKIGIPPSIVKPVFGSYDAARNVLTIIKADFKGEKAYVNSMWEIQKEPFKGDVINAYNDGVNQSGTQLGNFYEMETSSPAKELRKGQTLTHVNKVFHFMGSKSALNSITNKILGVSVYDLK